MSKGCGSEGVVYYNYTLKRETGQRIPRMLKKELFNSLECEFLRLFSSNGRYVEMDRSAALVKSTISISFSHDGRFFASTHGDHSVKVFEWPSGKQVLTLERHRRTPWTVKFHPFKRYILASGCIGNECCIWDLRHGSCVRSHKFPASISGVSFHPNGDVIAISSGWSIFLWKYGTLRKYPYKPGVDSTLHSSKSFRSLLNPVSANYLANWDEEDLIVLEPSEEEPYVVLESPLLSLPFHMVEFHPSGHFLLTGEKNRSSAELPFSLKLVLHRYNSQERNISSDGPLLVIPRAVAYNDAGVHFSPCGRMIAACVPEGDNFSNFQICIFSLVSRPDGVLMGDILYSIPLNISHVWALTNLKFSPSGRHLLTGFSFRSPSLSEVTRTRSWDYLNNEYLSSEFRKVDVVELYHLEADKRATLVHTLQSDVIYDRINFNPSIEDEINVAVFSSGGVETNKAADGLVYGTQKGRIRLFCHWSVPR
eukprot:jgi/Galph1/4812/GphlegSOOS_G3458.1